MGDNLKPLDRGGLESDAYEAQCDVLYDLQLLMSIRAKPEGGGIGNDGEDACFIKSA